MTAGEWELAAPETVAQECIPLWTVSEGWLSAPMKIANQYGGAFLCAFQTGLLTLFIALASPLHPLAERLLQFHMIQHLLLMMVIPPLLLLGAPSLPPPRGLPRPVLQRGLGPFFRLYRPSQRLAQFLTHPFCLLAFTEAPSLGILCPL